MANNETIPEREEALVSQAEGDVAALHKMVHGDKYTEVLTESGPVPSLAKWQNDASDFFVDAANRAEEARDTAMLYAGIYSTVAEGLLATVSGKYFSVVSSNDNEYLILYKNQAGTSVYIDTYPNAKALADALANFELLDLRNGYMLAFRDAAKRLGLGLTVDCKLDVGNFKDVVGHIKALESKAPVEQSNRSGYLLSFPDLADRLAVAIGNDGSLFNKGRNLLAEIDKIASGAANNKWITPSKNIASWGDSMSENNWQVILRTLMPDRNIYAGGVGGQKSGQIARRQGGIAPMITATGNTIPASGGVAVTVDVPFMFSSSVLYGHLYGVFGTLTIVGGVYTFTRAAPGVAVQIDEFTPFLLSSSEYDYDFRTTIIWAGNNDYQSQYRPEVDGNVTRMVEFLKPQDKRFIVIGMAIASYSDRLKGTQYYTDTMALHKKWRERWPNNFIDITPVLQRHYDPNNPTDVQNLLDGCTPSSLRKDEIHLNDTGNQIVANTIYNFLIQRGW